MSDREVSLTVGEETELLSRGSDMDVDSVHDVEVGGPDLWLNQRQHSSVNRDPYHGSRNTSSFNSRRKRGDVSSSSYSDNSRGDRSRSRNQQSATSGSRQDSYHHDRRSNPSNRGENSGYRPKPYNAPRTQSKNWSPKRKRTTSAIDVTTKIVHPFHVVIWNVPRIKVEGEIIKYEVPKGTGNPELTKALSSFVHCMPNTVKVQYGPNGPKGWGVRGVALATFGRLFEAEAVSKAFEARGRGREEWDKGKKVGGGSLAPPGDLYGWIAEPADMEDLNRVGAKTKYKLVSRSEVQAEERQEMEAVEAMKASMEKQQAELELTVNEKEALEMQRAAAGAEASEVLAALEGIEDKVRASLENISKFEEGIAKEHDEMQKVTEMANVFQEKGTLQEEAQKLQEEQKILENEVKTGVASLKEKSKNIVAKNKAVHQHHKDLQNASEQFLRSQAKTQELEREYEKNLKEWEAKQELRTKASKNQTLLDLYNGLDLDLGNECIICYDEFEPPPPEINPQKWTAKHKEQKARARHMFIPCAHANICGGCMEEMDKCKNPKCDGVGQCKQCPTCPTCRVKVDGSIVFRLTHA